MSKERIGNGNVVLIAIVLTLLAASASARVTTTCGPSIDGPVVIEESYLLGTDGKRAQEPADLRAERVVLGSGGELAKGVPVFTGETIEHGVIVNHSDARAWIRFSNGEVVILELGDAIAIGTAKCTCECTCDASNSGSRLASFPCSSSSDDCSHNGDVCRFTTESGTSHAGVFKDCGKVWQISHLEP